MELALKNKCLDVLNCKTEPAFLNHLVGFANHLGFEFSAAMIVTDHSDTFTEFQTLTNAPRAFLDDFHNLDKGKLDPVSQYCKRRSSPTFWDVDTYSSAGVGDLWDYQAAHGYRTGIATAMHFRRGRHFMIGFSGTNLRNLRDAARREVLDEFRTFSAYAQATAFDLCLPPVTRPDQKSTLTSREIDALRWTMDGKTTPNVAAMMSTTEEATAERLRSAMDKLGCGSKYEAVLQVIRLGLVHCD